MSRKINDAEVKEVAMNIALERIEDIDFIYASEVLDDWAEGEYSDEDVEEVVKAMYKHVAVTWID